MLPTNDALTNAFQVLSTIVRDFHSVGRPCLGATLKPELNRRAGFTELQFGFPRFGDFLRAASAAGYVQLKPTAGGDIAVFPSGTAVTDQASPALATPPLDNRMVPSVANKSWSARPRDNSLRIRQDLWNAFNSFLAPWVYDPATDLAYKESQLAQLEFDGSGFRSKHSLVQIPPAKDRVMEWMRSFAAIQEGAIKEKLCAALDGGVGQFQFTNLVRTDSKVWRSWRRYHIQQVLAAIDAWASSNNVHPKGVAVQSFWPERQSLPQPQPAPPMITAVQERASTPVQPVASDLTNRMDSLIDQLIDDLIKLRGLLQVYSSKQ